MRRMKIYNPPDVLCPGLLQSGSKGKSQKGIAMTVSEMNRVLRVCLGINSLLKHPCLMRFDKGLPSIVLPTPSGNYIDTDLPAITPDENDEADMASLDRFIATLGEKSKLPPSAFMRRDLYLPDEDLELDTSDEALQESAFMVVETYLNLAESARGVRDILRSRKN